MKDVFGQIRGAISAVEMGSFLGLQPDKTGRCRCPFHRGEDRNMKLYDGDKGFYCFVCHQSGDTTALFQTVRGISSPVEAANEIIAEFGLDVSPAKMAEKETNERQKWERAQKVANNLYRIALGLFEKMTGQTAPLVNSLLDGSEQLLREIDSF